MASTLEKMTLKSQKGLKSSNVVNYKNQRKIKIKDKREIHTFFFPTVYDLDLRSRYKQLCFTVVYIESLIVTYQKKINNEKKK